MNEGVEVPQQPQPENPAQKVQRLRSELKTHAENLTLGSIEAIALNDDGRFRETRYGIHHQRERLAANKFDNPIDREDCVTDLTANKTYLNEINCDIAMREDTLPGYKYLFRISEKSRCSQ